MTALARVRIRPWAWHHTDGTTDHGVMLSIRHAQIYIPAQQLQEIADALHDRADAEQDDR